jgi:hypothetical protein
MEMIGRWAAAQAVRERLLMHPGIGAIGTDAEGEVAHDARIHAGMPCILGGLPSMPIAAKYLKASTTSARTRGRSTLSVLPQLL